MKRAGLVDPLRLFRVATALSAVFWLTACPADPGNSNGQDAGDTDAYSCTDRCQQGERQCVTNGYQPCGNFNDDPCLEWGPVVSCNQGERCIDGVCEPIAFTDECIEGAAKCTDSGTGTRSCEYNGSVGVWVWGNAVSCDTGETCSCGVCRSTCVDECVQGSQRCFEEGYQNCGNFDADGCLEWGPVVPCTGGQTCSDGSCNTGCVHECTAGALRCSCSGHAVQYCGDYDGDACLEWGPEVPCLLGETCSNGICSGTCQDECGSVGERQCTTSGGGYQVCDDYNSDGCREWGPDIACPSGESCRNGVCDVYCECDNRAGTCEAGAPNSTTPCGCDPDCGTPCVSDGYCDTWCTQGADPDCGCGCDFNEYCEAEFQGSSSTCPCDWDCELHETACSDDGHCDSWCPSGADPDCGVNACRSRFMLVGWRNADEMWLTGNYTDPDPTHGAPWVLLSPGLSGGQAEMIVEFAAEHISCVDGIKVEAYGYDDSTFGDGAEFYLYDWNGAQFDLLPDETFGSSPAFYSNQVINPLPYILCGTGQYAKCYIDAQISASGWDNTHVWDVYVYVHMSL